jgi:site-specific DNA-methyltransferase (adenine-specific)
MSSPASVERPTMLKQRARRPVTWAFFGRERISSPKKSAPSGLAHTLPRVMTAARRPIADEILLGDNIELLPRFSDGSFQLIYIDPPFNTGRAQARVTLQTVAHEDGDRTGFQGRRYVTRPLAESSYSDTFDDYLAFLAPRLRHAHRLLAREGTLYFHIDYREAHYCKLLLDEIFGRDCFLNEIVWAYDYGARARRRWPAKHDTILVYVKDPHAYLFDSEGVDREPYMAPALVTPEKAARGKLPTDVWWHTIVPTNGAEKTGYPTQKPEGIVRRMVLASTRPGDWCLDFFAGSGTLGAVAAALDRHYVLIDSNPQAVQIMRSRLSGHSQTVAGSG